MIKPTEGDLKMATAAQAENLAIEAAMRAVRELRILHNEYVARQPDDIDPEERMEPIPFVEPTADDQQIKALAKGFLKILRDRGLA